MATIEQASFTNRGRHTLPYEAIKNALKTRADAKNLARTAAEDAIDAAVESFAEYEIHSKKASLSSGRILHRPYEASIAEVPKDEDPAHFVLNVRSRGKDFGAKVAAIFMTDVIAEEENTTEALKELERFKTGYYVNPLVVTLELTPEQTNDLNPAQADRLERLDQAMDDLAVPSLYIFLAEQ